MNRIAIDIRCSGPGYFYLCPISLVNFTTNSLLMVYSPGIILCHYNKHNGSPFPFLRFALRRNRDLPFSCEVMYSGGMLPMRLMKNILIVISIILTELFSQELVSAQAFNATIDERDKTQLLILGTQHLENLGTEFSKESLTNVLNTLMVFKPDLIGLESIPPILLHDMATDHAEYGQVIKQFAGHRQELGRKMQDRLGKTWHEAHEEAEQKLAEVGVASRPEERAAVIPLLVAAYDDLTALLQWCYIPETIQDSVDLVPEEVRSYLNMKKTSKNERVLLGVTLARSLEHQRLYYVDDHQDKDIYMKIVEDLIRDLKENSAYESISSDPHFISVEESLQKAVKANDLFPHFQYINSSEFGPKDASIQWDLWFKIKLTSGLDRTRMALWEVRNLNMASHIRRVTALNPGGRALVIVGVGHKPFLESYLNQMTDLSLVQFNDLLLSK